MRRTGRAGLTLPQAACQSSRAPAEKARSQEALLWNPELSTGGCGKSRLKRMEIWILIVWIIVWGLLGMWCGQHRGWKGDAAFAIGVLLGPIGLLVILAGADTRPKCTECLAPIDPRAHKCRRRQIAKMENEL